MTSTKTSPEPWWRTPPLATPVMRSLAPDILPAIVIGVVCSLVLLAISWAAGQLTTAWWETLPRMLGVAPDSPWWIVAVLVGTGVLTAVWVGLIPGHGGTDPATTSLVDSPISPVVVPGLAGAVILSLAGGVSLGPENPIMAVNTSLVLMLSLRLFKRGNAALWAQLAVAGTIGALFANPLAAALLFSEFPEQHRPGTTPAKSQPLWNRLITPLLAASAGALTTRALTDLDMSLDLPSYPGFRPWDLLSGPVIAVLAAAVGMVAVWVFPLVHRLFGLMRHQVIVIPVAGVLLAGLGVLTGPIGLFKGLDQLTDLTTAWDNGGYTWLGFLGLALARMLAVVVASAGGFRGGRIFPSLFGGVALGYAAAALIPAIPVSLAVVAAAFGMLVAVTRQGWLSFFMALIIVPQVALIPALCILAVPAWLVVSGRREMTVPKPDAIAV